MPAPNAKSQPQVYFQADFHRLACFENRIRYVGRLHRCFHIVRSQDVRTFEDQSSVNSEISVEPVFNGGIFPVFANMRPRKDFFDVPANKGKPSDCNS